MYLAADCWRMTKMNVLKTLLRGLGVVLVLAFACAAVLIGYTVWDISTIDPFDKFELLGVVSDSRLQRHGAIYRYYHANSSATVTAVWILSGEPPSVGSKSPARGKPVLIWTGRPRALQLSWQQGEERILVEVKAPADIRKDANFTDCYFDEYSPVNLLCVWNTIQVDVRVAPAG
jgi:hypothetical protein